MEKIKLKADARDVGTKGLTRVLRKGEAIPAVLYGKGEKPMALSVNTKEFTHLMKGASGRNALVELEIGGKGVSDRVVVMLKDYQTDMIRHEITHIDLLKINMKEKVLVKVPVHLVGKAIGLQKGGLVELVRRELEVRCLPDKIPDKIDVDITNLDIGHSLHLKDCPLPEGIESAQAQDLTVVSVVAPREEVIEAPAAAVPAEGAAAPAEGAAAPAAGAAGAAAKPEGKAEAKGEKK